MLLLVYLYLLYLTTLISELLSFYQSGFYSNRYAILNFGLTITVCVKPISYYMIFYTSTLPRMTRSYRYCLMKFLMANMISITR